MGDRGASQETLGWHFRGQRIVRSVLAHLVKAKGLGKQQGTRLIFGIGQNILLMKHSFHHTQNLNLKSEQLKCELESLLNYLVKCNVVRLSNN